MRERTWAVVGWVAVVMAGIAAAIAALMLVSGGMRWFSSATAPTKIIEPEDGIHCLTVYSSDGVAVDCWRNE